MAVECDVDQNGGTTYWNNTCTSVDEVCSYYNQTWSPTTLDQFNFTQCNNGTHDLPLNKVRTQGKECALLARSVRAAGGLFPARRVH